MQSGVNEIANDRDTSNGGNTIDAKARQRATPFRRLQGLKAGDSLRRHWLEYVMEIGELGLYMLSACAFATLLQHPASPVRHLVMSDLTRRALMGLAMGATVIALVLSPWGKQSGGHFNPAITLTYYRLGKVEFWDAWFYTAAQFAGAIAGVAAAGFVLRGAPGDPAVRYAATAPGTYGIALALVAELAISCVLMLTVLYTTNHARLAPYTPYFAGLLVAIYITFESPLSGMSTNPARTFASAIRADYWHALWIYFLAPTAGMLIAAEVFLRARGGVPPFCAKLYHANNKRCIFHHGSYGNPARRSLEIRLRRTPPNRLDAARAI